MGKGYGSTYRTAYASTYLLTNRIDCPNVDAI